MRDRILGAAALVVGGLAITTIAAATLMGGGSPAPIAARHSQPPASPSDESRATVPPSASPSQTPLPSPTASPSPTPVPIVAVDVPVVACAIRDASGDVIHTFKPSERLQLPASIADEVAVFATNYSRILAPSDWHCAAEIGGNGTMHLEVAPAGDHSMSVVIDDAAATYGDILALACPFFPDAAKQLKLELGSSCDRVDSREAVKRVGKTVVWFADPAGVAGSGAGSGGANPVAGVVRYVGGREATAAKASCRFPEDQITICGVILQDWLDRQSH